LDDGELNLLFQAIDRAGKGMIDYNMFNQEFPEINGKQDQSDLRFISISFLHAEED
jgi:hypothetical protein